VDVPLAGLAAKQSQTSRFLREDGAPPGVGQRETGIIEAVRGRPLSDRAQEIGFRIGFALVVMLMIFTVFNDTMQLLP